jgi:hypothetical protein
VQTAEQLDGPFVVGEKHVGKADAVGVDDERHPTCSRVSSDLAWETSTILA